MPRSPATEAVVLAMAAIAAAVAVGWIGARLAWPLAVSAAASFGAALAAALVARACLRREAVTLDWDAQRWTLATPHASCTGDIAVAIDLGAWLLVRFRASSAPRRWRWLALQRRGLDVHWHALRCALYSPRPGGAEPGLPAAASNSKNDRP